MKRISISLLVVILIGIMAWSCATAAVVSHDTKPRPLYYDQWEPTNAEIDSLTKLVRELNKGQFPDPLKIRPGSAIRIPNPKGQHLDVVWEKTLQKAGGSYSVQQEKMDTLRFDIVIARTYVPGGDNHDCMWWASRDYLISNQAKPRTVDPAPIPVKLIKPEPFRTPWWIWAAMLPLLIAILVLAIAEYMESRPKSPERWDNHSMIPGGLNETPQTATIQITQLIQSRGSNPDIERVECGRLIRNSGPRLIECEMQFSDRTRVVVMRNGDECHRVTYRNGSKEFYRTHCGNLFAPISSGRFQLPEGWEFLSSEGGTYVVPQPEAPAATQAAAPEQPATQQSAAPAVAEPSAPPASTVTEPTSAQTPRAPFKEPLDLHQILQDPRVIYLHFKQGDTEIKIDLKGGAKAVKSEQPKEN